MRILQPRFQRIRKYDWAPIDLNAIIKNPFKRRGGTPHEVVEAPVGDRIEVAAGAVSAAVVRMQTKHRVAVIVALTVQVLLALLRVFWDLWAAMMLEADQTAPAALHRMVPAMKGTSIL